MRRAPLLALTLLLTACREAVPIITQPPPLEHGAVVRQVTFGYGHDRDPRWLPDGSALLYHTDRFGMLPAVNGVALSLDPELVRATPLFGDLQQRALQLGAAFTLATPVPAPDGDRIAYMDLQVVDWPASCAVPPTPPPPPASFATCASMQPLLGSAVLRVRRIDAIHPHINDPAITVHFEGSDPRYRATDLGPYYERTYPFQELHRSEQALLFRPSWAPDGERIVLSDGLRVLVWRVGSATLDTVPGTAGGVSPAWSPDGQWIAYTELVRGDSATALCSCQGAIGPKVDPQFHWRTVYRIDEYRLVVMRPDGTQRTVLGEGMDPTWSPDGQHIYALRDGIIVRVPRAGGSAVVVPHTQRARSPAVSPDGRWLAFSRIKTTGLQDHDIWLVSLTP